MINLRIVEEEFGEELTLERTPQTLTLVGELEEGEEDEDEHFTNPHAFSSLEENFDNPTELFTNCGGNKEEKEQFKDGVVPADNLSGNASKMYAPF